MAGMPPGHKCAGPLAPTLRGIGKVTGNADRRIEMSACWLFHCPECGFGERELGRNGGDHDLYCEVCLEETGVRVRLLRWYAEQAEAAAEAAERESKPQPAK